MPKLIAISDLHGHLPELPKADILLIGGDICPVYNHDTIYQAGWILSTFCQWLESLDIHSVYVCGGNHDIIMEKGKYLLGNMTKLPFVYLEDKTVMDRTGLIIHGSPHQLPFGVGWVFNRTEEQIAHYMEAVPSNTDILLLHGPPKGYGDRVPRYNCFPRTINYSHLTESVGSQSITNKILEVKPKLVIYGHVHEGYGKYWTDDKSSLLLNASYVNERYQPCNDPWIVDWTDRPRIDNVPKLL
jgi:Icc-related predicted phosphoesterase